MSDSNAIFDEINRIYGKYCERINEIVDSGQEIANLGLEKTGEDITREYLNEVNEKLINQIIDVMEQLFSGNIPNSVYSELNKWKVGESKIERFEIDALENAIKDELIKRNRTEEQKSVNDTDQEFVKAYASLCNNLVMYKLIFEIAKGNMSFSEFKTIEKINVSQKTSQIRVDEYDENEESRKKATKKFVELNRKLVGTESYQELIKIIKDRINNSMQQEQSEKDKILSSLETSSDILENLGKFSYYLVEKFKSDKGFEIKHSKANPTKDEIEEEKAEIARCEGFKTTILHKVLLNEIANELRLLKQIAKNAKKLEFEEKCVQCMDLVDEYLNKFPKGCLGMDEVMFARVLDKCRDITNQGKSLLIENSEEHHKFKDMETINSQDMESIEVSHENETRVNEVSESAIELEQPTKPQTLRQKFDINSEEDFDKLLVHYAKVNKDYYSNTGKKSEEDVKRRRNINSQMKRILNKKALSMPQNENGEDFASTIKSIERGNVFSYAELKLVAENKKATMMLFNIMASGVYEKNGEKIRLTQKQRVALASTLEIVSGMRLDMDKPKKAEFGGVVLTTENAKQVEA